MTKYRIIYDIAYDYNRYIVEKDVSLFNGLFGRTWNYAGMFPSLTEAESYIEKCLVPRKVIGEYGT